MADPAQPFSPPIRRGLTAAVGVALGLRAWVEWRGDGGFEHLPALVEQLDLLVGGSLELAEDRETDPTGGGQLVFLLFAPLALVGLSPGWLLGVQLALQAAGIAGWLRSVRGVLAPRVAWGAAAVLAANPWAGRHLAENSVLLCAVVPPLLGLTLTKGRRWSIAVLAGLAVHLSLVALPVAAVAAFSRRERRGPVAVVVTLALLPLLLVDGGPAELLPGLVDEVLREGERGTPNVLTKLGWLLLPWLALGLAEAVRKPQRLAVAVARPRLLLAWIVLGSAPVFADAGAERFHLQAVAPAVALLAGGALALLAGRRWPAAAMAAMFLPPLLALPGADQWRGEERFGRCPSLLENACPIRETLHAAATVRRLGIEPPPRVVGAYGACVDAALAWTGPQNPDRWLALLADGRGVSVHGAREFWLDGCSVTAGEHRLLVSIEFDEQVPAGFERCVGSVALQDDATALLAPGQTITWTRPDGRCDEGSAEAYEIEPLRSPP